MRVLTTIAATRDALDALRSTGKSIGLVPTMGALHAGHLALVAAARAACDTVAVSIFVNPTQFGPSEDFSKYPRTFDQDCRTLEAAGVDFVFAPAVLEMYPSGAGTFVEVAGVSDRLDGASRPGHFRGVATVVSKLLHIFQPDRVFFGQKDAAQVAVLRKMVRDLAFRVAFEVCPTVREPDGLALSSRNRYLSEKERKQALVLFHSIRRIADLAANGEISSQQLIASGRAVLAEEPEVRVDYLVIVDPETLEDLPEARPGAMVAVAAYVGTTRLIDNLGLETGLSPQRSER